MYAAAVDPATTLALVGVIEGLYLHLELIESEYPIAGDAVTYPEMAGIALASATKALDEIKEVGDGGV